MEGKTTEAVMRKFNRRGLLAALTGGAIAKTADAAPKGVFARVHTTGPSRSIYEQLEVVNRLKAACPVPVIGYSIEMRGSIAKRKK